MPPSVSDIMGDQEGSSLSQSLGAGMGNIAYDGTVTFRLYRRVVLPIDGFVFWVGTTNTTSVPGSLHVETHSRQDEIQSYDHSEILFSTSKEVHPFHNQTPDTLWLGNVTGIPFAINGQKQRYQQAGLFHYFGESIPPSHSSQFIANEAELDEYTPVVGTSLPLFLAMPQLSSPALSWCPWPENVPVFPSFNVPDNQPPPYVVIHNDPHSVTSESMGSVHPETGDSNQIIQERVRLTLIGLAHKQAANIRDYILHWSLLHPEQIGVVNSPALRDEKRPLGEINALAMIKTLDLDIMYSQNTARNAALQLIENAKVALTNATRQNPSV